MRKNNNRIFCLFVYLLICLFIHNLQWQILVFTNRPLDQTNLILNSIEKVKTFFLLSLMSMFPELNGTKFWSHSFHSKIHVFCRTEWSKGGTPWKWILTIFKYKYLSKISKSIKAIYLYPSEITHHAVSVHSMFYRGLSNNSQDIEEYPKKCWLSRNSTKFISFKR